MADEQRLTWILELKPDATSLFAVADQIEARFKSLQGEAASRRAPGLVGSTGNVSGSVATQQGELEAQASIVQQRLEQAARRQPYLRALVDEAKAKIDPNQFRTGINQVVGNRNVAGVTSEGFNKLVETANRGALRTAAEVEAANTSLAGATSELAKARLEESLQEAKIAEALANSPGYIGNVVNKRSAQTLASAKIEEGLASPTSDAGKQYNASLARVRVAQEQILAQLKERLASEGLAADGVGAYARLVARAAIAQAAINAQTEQVLAGDDKYIASLALTRASHAKEAAGVEELLAAQTALGDEYVAAKAALAASRRQIDASVKAVNTGTIVVPGEDVSTTETNSAFNQRTQDLAAKQKALALQGIDVDLAGQSQIQQAGIVAAGQKELTNREKLAEVTEQLARLRQAEAAGETSDLDIQEQIRVAQGELNSALKKQVAAAQLAGYQNRVAQGGDPGTLFQRVQSGISARDGNFRDPQEFQKFGQFLSSRFLTTAGFAVSGLATYAVFAGLQKMVTDSAALEKILQQVKAEFTALGDGANFNGFRNGILQISRDTGEAAKDVAALALQFKGAFGQQFNNTQILDQVKAAVELSRVTGISLDEIENNLTGTAVTYGTNVRHISDVVLTLGDRTGVAAKESIQALSDMAVAANDAGLTVEQAGSIATVAAKYTGQSGASVAEGLNRVLPAIGTKAAQIVALFQQANPSQLGKVSDALASGDTGKVFDLLGQGYDKLSRAQKNYLISLLGSRRDAKTVIDVFQHYGEVQNDVAASIDSSGRLEKSYGALQDTLSQQLSRVASSFKNIGAALLSLGLSDLIQNLAKVIGLLVGAVSDVVSIFAKLNDVTGGIPAKLLAIAAAVKIISLLGSATAGPGILGGALSIIPSVGGSQGGIKSSIASKSGTQIFTTEETAATGSIVNRAPSIAGGALGKLGSKIETATADSSKIIATSGAKMGQVLTGLGEAIETFAPIALILLITAGVEDAIKGYQQVKDKLGGLQTDILGEGGFSTTAGQKDLDAYGKARDKAIHHGLSFNPFTDIKNAGEVIGGLTSKSESQVGADQVQQSTTKAFGSVLENSFSKDQLNDLRNAYNKQANQFNDQNPGQHKATLSESDLKDISKHGTTDDKQFQAVIDLFTQSAAEKKGLGQAYSKIINGDKNHAKDISDLKEGLQDLPTLQIEYETGERSSESFIGATSDLLDTTQRLLIDAIKKHADPAYIQGLKQSFDQEKQLRDQAVDQRIKELTDQATQAASLKGLNPDASNQLVIQATTAALATTPHALQDANNVAVAQSVYKNQQTQLQSLADHAKTQADAQKILDNGFKVSPTILRFLQIGALKALPKNFADPLRESAKLLGHRYETILEELVLAKGGFENGLKGYIQTIKDKIAELIAIGGHDADIAKLNNDLTALNALGASGLVPGGKGGTADVAAPTRSQREDAYNSLASAAASQDPLAAAVEARREAAQKYNDAVTVLNDPKSKPGQKKQAKVDATSAAADQIKADQQYNDATDAIANSKQAVAASLANGDPVKEAQSAIDAATLQMQQASSRGDEAGYNNALAAYNQAQFQMQQALEGISQAYVSVLSAAADGNAVKAAQASVVAAQIQAANAHGEADKLNALAAEISAQHALRDSLNALADAQKNIVLATLQAAGKTVEAAKEQQKIDKEAFQRYLAQHPGSTVQNDATAAGLYQKTISDAAATRDAALNNAVEDINFGLSTHKIFNSQAIARLKILDQNQKLTKAEHQSLETQIYNLQHQSEQDLQFNLPSDIQLPTLYEARRFNSTPGGGQHYQDSRQINIEINTNAKLDGKDVQHLTDQVTTAISAPPRYGTRTRTY